jgi:hypothetical protein
MMRPLLVMNCLHFIQPATKYTMPIKPTTCTQTLDLTCYTNATFIQQFTYLEPDGVTVIDLTGMTCAMQVRQIEAPFTLVVDCGPYISTGGVLGTISIQVPYALTQTLSVGNYDYDLILISGSVHTRLLGGLFAVVEGVTP